MEYVYSAKETKEPGLAVVVSVISRAMGPVGIGGLSD